MNIGDIYKKLFTQPLFHIHNSYIHKSSFNSIKNTIAIFNLMA